MTTAKDSTNDFLRQMDQAINHLQAVRQIVKQQAEQAEVGKAEPTYFANADPDLPLSVAEIIPPGGSRYNDLDEDIPF